MSLRRDVDELTSSSRPHSSQLSIQRELDSVKERHRKQVADLEQTIDGLRQQLLRLHAKELGRYVCVLMILFDLPCVDRDETVLPYVRFISFHPHRLVTCTVVILSDGWGCFKIGHSIQPVKRIYSDISNNSNNVHICILS